MKIAIAISGNLLAPEYNQLLNFSQIHRLTSECLGNDSQNRFLKREIIYHKGNCSESTLNSKSEEKTSGNVEVTNDKSTNEERESCNKSLRKLY